MPKFGAQRECQMKLESELRDRRARSVDDLVRDLTEDEHREQSGDRAEAVQHAVTRTAESLHGVPPALLTTPRLAAAINDTARQSKEI